MRGVKSSAVKCPHCRTAFNEAWNTYHVGNDAEGAWLARSLTCPECNRVVVKLAVADPKAHAIVRREFIAYPKTSGRGPVSADVPTKYADDYTESCLVMPDSPKAS